MAGVWQRPGLRGLILLVGLLSADCVHTRNFQAPDERIVHRTAYTVRKKEVMIDAGLVGLEITDVGVLLGVTGGITNRFQMGTNVGHLSLGVASLNAKGNLLDRRWVGLGLSTSVLYTSPRVFWALPDDLQRDLGNVHVLFIPMRLHSSFPVARWVTLNLNFGYRHFDVFGNLKSGTIVAEGGLGTRDIYFEPGATFFIAKRVAILGGAHLSPWAAARVNAIGRIELEPGVRAGALRATWDRRPFAETFRWHAAVDVRFGGSTHLRVGAAGGGLEPLTDFPAVPYVNLYWRLGGPNEARLDRETRMYRARRERKAAARERRDQKKTTKPGAKEATRP